jgi:hypothetical protein
VQLPLILAGPILRRVEPNLVSVWVALSQSASVKLNLWERRVAAGSGNILISGPDPAAATIRLGDKLHLAMVTLKIPPASTKTLRPGQIYSYDLELTPTGQGAKQTLKSLGLLETKKINGKQNEALGYETDFLPSFALPPKELTELRIIHGSCRRAAADFPDGFVWVDDLISKDNAYKDPLKRPHQLFLSGDQIYADDVARLHLHMLIETGKTLIGGKPDASGTIPIERLTVEHVREGDGAPKTETASFLADQRHFPPGWRDDLILTESRMTSHDGHSHLISFGEFAAMYLSVWSNVTWPDEFPKEELFIPPLNLPVRRPANLTDPLKDDKGNDPDAQNREEKVAGLRQAYQAESKFLKVFLDGLPKVRRALANVPTYMIFDDHEVTDDWYLNPVWRDRVLTTVMGKTIIRNGMLAYALFQGWGNDPVKFESGDYKRLLEHAAALFPAGATQGPNETAGGEIDRLLGLGLRSEAASDGAYAPTNPPLKWNYSVPGEKHLVVALDNRTRRSYVSSIGPPGNVAISAQAEQIPQGSLPAGKEVLIVIAPLQLIGPPVFDELLAPIAYQAHDVKDFNALQRKPGTRGLTGTNPDAVDGWAFDKKTFEALLKRLEPYRRVVLLSGDVHYGAGNAMSYWKKDDVEPARFAQFTSSGMRNVMPATVRFISRSFAFAQEIIRAEIGTEMLAWENKPADLLQLPPNSTVNPRLQAKLRSNPVMIPTRGWPKGTKLKTTIKPDWAWRVDAIRDVRPDAARPEMARPVSLFPGDQDKKDNDIDKSDVEGYHRAAIRHARQLEKLNNCRQILFASNIGLITFAKKIETVAETNSSGEVIYAVQELFTAFKNQEPEAFARHEIALRDMRSQRPVIE